MIYKIIFSTGYDDDIDSIAQSYKADVLILDQHGEYYRPQFITLERLYNEAVSDPCYLEENLVILKQVTKETILASIKKLHHWKFQERWRPLTEKEMTYFGPTDKWYIVDVTV